VSLKKSSGNMYGWVTHTISFLHGRCSHECKYCYVQAMARKFPNMRSAYSGPIRLNQEAFKIHLGKGRTIFVEHLNDLFAANVPAEFITRVLKHCGKFPGNTYVFQSKNPWRFLDFTMQFPKQSTLGTTVESNIFYPEISNANPPTYRLAAITTLVSFQRFVTIEPVLEFNEMFIKYLRVARPDFVNIGADSKGYNLPSPSRAKILQLISELRAAGIEVREKTNLSRLTQK